MFKKPKRNFRGRQRDSESDDEKDEGRQRPASAAPNAPDPTRGPAGPTTAAETETTTNSSSSQSKRRERAVQKGPSSNPIVSFEQEEDGDGEVFQIKKPTHSKRIVRQIKKESLKEKLEPNIKLEAEQFNGNSSGKEKTEVKAEYVKSEDDDEDDNEFDDDDDEFSGSHNNSREPSVQDILKSGQIPDANMIHLARKRRQRARELGDDFVPIDDTVRFENRSSRLIRDDDNDVSDCEDENFAITTQQKESNRRRLEERILAAEEESHSETSDQEREWEEQQIRKGVSIPAQAATTFSIGGTNNGANYCYNQYQPYMYGGQTLANASASSVMSYGMESMARVGGIQFPNLQLESEPISLESSKEKLTKRLTDMLDRHRLNVHNRDEMSSRRELNQESIGRLSGQTRGLEEQFKFFQEMRGYVRDLVECMNEKMSSINFLDRCMMNLWKERAKKLITRHQEDVKDQSLEYSTGKGGASVPLVDKGGPGEQGRNQRRADREGRRNRRKLAREAKGIRDHCDGMSTDDEFSISELKKYKSERDRLIYDSSTALDDVMDDFCQYSLIKRRFETWKSDYSDSYNEAYIGLCLTKLFTPLVKLELVSWNPLEPNCVDFEQSRWFNSLIFYGYKKGALSEDDPDIKLVPNIVEKVLLPRLTTLVEGVWNPLSLQETRRLVAVIRRLVENYPTITAQSKNTQGLIKSVVERIKKTLNDDVFMPLYPKQVLENRSSGPSIFFHRQFWLCVKLFNSIILWDGILSQRHVQQLAFDSLLNRYVTIAIPNVPFGPEFVSMCQAIVALIPKDWFSDCKNNTTAPQLENFCRCLVNSAASSSSSTDMRDLVRQIGKILISIRAIDHVTSLANRVNFKVVD